jgi:hypothetical protein
MDLFAPPTARFTSIDTMTPAITCGQSSRLTSPAQTQKGEIFLMAREVSK